NSRLKSSLSSSTDWGLTSCRGCSGLLTGVVTRDGPQAEANNIVRDKKNTNTDSVRVFKSSFRASRKVPPA
ncbi:MAG: hypothetical protein ACWGP1_15155, partial [Syntrophobacteria bacterium]